MKYSGSSRNAQDQSFYAWQPSTWPAPPASYNEEFRKVLRQIFHDSMLIEIENVMRDVPTLEHRGHVVSLSILCAIDTVSSYAFRNSGADRCESCHRTDNIGPQYKKYIRDFFPAGYPQFADKIYRLYRNPITHSWNLFEAGMLPGDEMIKEVNGTIIFGLRNFFNAFKESVDTFLNKLISDSTLQQNALLRYGELKNTARP